MATARRYARSRLRTFPLYLALSLFLFGIYVLTYTPRINSSDGLAMFSTAESLVRRGSLDIEQIRWMGLQQGTYGLDGLLYSRKGLGLPLGLLPLIWLGLRVPGWGAVGAALLFNAVVTALTAALLWAYVQRLGYSRRTGLGVALTFGLFTLAWPYAKSLFSDPLAGLLLLAAAYFLLKVRLSLVSPESSRSVESESDLSARWPIILYSFLAGLCLGWNVATRYAEAVFLPVFGLLLLHYLWLGLRPKQPKVSHPSHFSPPPPSNPHPPTSTLLASPITQTAITAFVAPIVLISMALIAFNMYRYGDPLNTGYLPEETFGGVLWQGLVGQLISPGRGLFLYSPILALSLWGLPAGFRRFRAEAVAALAVILIHLFLYGKWFMWHGGFAWGPRFMVPTLPFWAIFLAPAIHRAFPEKTPAGGEREPAVWSTTVLRVAFIGLAVLSLVPQFLGVMVDFSHFQGALLDTGLPLFAPETFFAPKYSPLPGTLPYLSTANLDLAWAWQGRFNGWLLAALMVNVALTGLGLVVQRRWPGVVIASVVSTLTATGLLLSHVHILAPSPFQQAVAALNEAIRPQDAIITNDPGTAIPFAELYQGRAAVLGLNNGGFPLPADVSDRLEQLIKNHRQVWWLPNWLPPEQSAIEQILLSTGFQARNDNYAGQRLLLFAYPDNLKIQTTTPATFANDIWLLAVAYPDENSAGLALPVRLEWQAQSQPDQDYHVFIHLVTLKEQLVVQSDGAPASWTRPTSTWSPGERIMDRHGLWLPPDIPAGLYQLRIGLYHPATGRRQTLAGGAEWVQLEVTIVPETQ